MLEDELMAALAADAMVPEAEIVAFYRTNRRTRFGPSVTARHILVADDAAAAAVLRRLRAGEPFASVAKDASIDGVTARSGGRLGTIRPGTTLAPIEDALFSAKPGKVLGPVRTELGVHVLAVDSRQGARPLAAVREEIRRELAMALGRQRLADLIAREAKNARAWVDDEYGRWEAKEGIVLPPS